MTDAQLDAFHVTMNHLNGLIDTPDEERGVAWADGVLNAVHQFQLADLRAKVRELERKVDSLHAARAAVKADAPTL